MVTQSARSKKTCDVCDCTFDNVSTGIHIMIKTKGRKIVCGTCAAQLEQLGWKERSRAK